MSLYSGRLAPKKKSELQEIASELGLESEGTKDDLSQKITDYINAGGARGDARFADLNVEGTPAAKRNGRRSTGSPSKRTSPTSEESDEDESDIKKTTRRASQKVVEKSRALIETDPKDVANYVEKRTDAAWKAVKDAFGSLHLRKSLHKVQHRLSHVNVIIGLSVLFELALFLLAVVPFTYKVHLGPTHSLITGKDHTLTLSLPDLFILFQWQRFWYPLLLWATSTLILPLVAAYFVNLEPRRHTYSPLTFSLVKGLVIYTTAFYGLFPPAGAAHKVAHKAHVIPTSHTHGFELVHLLINPTVGLADSVVGAVFALYEATVHKRH